MTERAGLWLRVSTGAQDEANQLPDLHRWCQAHDYEIAETYTVHGKSAYHGSHAQALERAFAGIEGGSFTVLVVWAADRLDRRGALSALTLAERARKAGGRIEYVKDAHLNAANEMSDVMLALSATLARQESRRKAERIVAKQEALRASGSLVGRAPWGYEIETLADGRKALSPTPEGRKYVPQIFAAVIAGRSLRDVAAWLDAEGVSPMQGGKWHESYLGNSLLRNPVYYGARRNSGQLVTPALVTPSTWQEANAALSGRVRPGRTTTVHPKPLMSVYCGQCYGQVRDGCPSGHSPMYRVFTGKGRNRKPYFRCTGHGPQRKGCGAPMLPVEQVEADVMRAMFANKMPHYERVFVAGDDRSDEIARLRERGAAAMRSGDYESATEAMREAAGLEALPRVAPHWEERETDQSEADYFGSLDREAQRAYLAERLITATREGVAIVPRWIAG